MRLSASEVVLSVSVVLSNGLHLAGLTATSPVANESAMVQPMVAEAMNGFVLSDIPVVLGWPSPKVEKANPNMQAKATPRKSPMIAPLAPIFQVRTTTKFIGTVPLLGYDRVMNRKAALSLPLGNRMYWMVSFPPNCTNFMLQNFCHNVLPFPATCQFIGNPSNRGLSYVHVLAHEIEISFSILKAPGARYVEADGPIKAIDGVPMGQAMAKGSSGIMPGPHAGMTPRQRFSPFSNGVTPFKHHTGGVPWNLDRIDDRVGLDGTYDDGFGGAGVHVYVLDTGVDTTHREFEGRAVPTLDVVGGTPKECQPSDRSCADDKVGHGTHTAGTVGSKTFGVAKQCTIHAVKVLNDKGGGAFAWFVAAVDWVMTHAKHPAVITASLGGDGQVLSMKEAIEGAVNEGIAVVVAAGNEGADACNYSPSFVNSAIAVGSVDQSDSLSAFSNFGSCVDLFAPGSEITSIYPGDAGLATMSGSSMAAPHVAGAVALMFGEVRVMSVSQMTQDLTAKATNGVLNGVGQPGTPNKLVFTGGKAESQNPSQSTKYIESAFEIPFHSILG